MTGTLISECCRNGPLKDDSKSRSIPYSKEGNCSRKTKKNRLERTNLRRRIWQEHTPQNSMSKANTIAHLQRQNRFIHTKSHFQTGLISSSFKCPSYTIEYNVFLSFFSQISGERLCFATYLGRSPVGRGGT